MAIGTYTLKFDESWTEPGDVRVLAFEGVPDIAEEAGQFVQVELPESEEMNVRLGERRLGIASAPEEGRLLLAGLVSEPGPTRKLLDDLKPGDGLPVSTSRGHFTLEESDRNAQHVLVGCGLGIAAVRSLVAHAAKAGTRLDLVVAQTPVNGGYPFQKDLQAFARDVDTIRYVQLDTIPDSADALDRIPGVDPKNARWYVAGPEGTVTTMQHTLESASVAAHRVKTEIYATG